MHLSWDIPYGYLCLYEKPTMLTSGRPAYYRSSIGLYIGESVPLQMKLPMYQLYTRLGQNKFPT